MKHIKEKHSIAMRWIHFRIEKGKDYYSGL